MSTKYTISAIITSYNGAHCIGKAIDSIYSQEGIGEQFEVEILVVDDCSTDRTKEIVKSYSDVKYFETATNSGGPNKGRNIALNHCTGDYLCIVDQDDVWLPNRIISSLPYFNKYNIITCGYNVIDKNEGKEFDRVLSTSKADVEFAKNQTFVSKLTRDYSGQNTYLGAIMYSSQLKNILFEEHFGVVDFDWILKLFKDQSSVEVCQPLYLRIIEGNNLSLNPVYRRIDYYYSLMFTENYAQEYPKEVALAQKKINGTRARYFYFIGDMKNARTYFLKSELSVKTIMYWLTTFAGSGYVKRKFNVFG